MLDWKVKKGSCHTVQNRHNERRDAEWTVHRYGKHDTNAARIDPSRFIPHTLHIFERSKCYGSWNKCGSQSRGCEQGATANVKCRNCKQPGNLVTNEDYLWQALQGRNDIIWNPSCCLLGKFAMTGPRPFDHSWPSRKRIGDFCTERCKLEPKKSGTCKKSGTRSQLLQFQFLVFHMGTLSNTPSPGRNNHLMVLVGCCMPWHRLSGTKAALGRPWPP